jgi:hypothetical protein
MRIIIEIDEGATNKSARTATDTPILHVDGGQARAELVRGAQPTGGDARRGTDAGGVRVHREPPSEVRFAHNPLRAGSAIERGLTERIDVLQTGKTDAGPPAHLAAKATHPSPDSNHRRNNKRGKMEKE